MIVDVELGGHKLYALSQGEWDGVGRGFSGLARTPDGS